MQELNLNYLNIPVTSIINPPVETNLQELPLEELIWEDFEKLCLTLIQIEFTINDCEIYGTKGQAQAGIDIYAKLPNGRYNSYQCKRYQEYNVVDIENAIEYFKKKKFFLLSDKFYICTSCEWNKTQIQDKFNEYKDELFINNIELIKWDKIQLNRMLKKQPQIVYDFFGVEWVKKFNGEIALDQLSRTKKLDAIQIAKFRKELNSFYSTIFNVQDPGIPIQELNNSTYPLQERFVIPDIYSNVKSDYIENRQDKIPTNLDSEDFDEDTLYYNEYIYSKSEHSISIRKKIAKEFIEENNIEIRISVDEALCKNNRRNIIIGDPGSGKSTLLRFIVLDILSQNPVLENISKNYGKLLPVWLPFAFITKYLNQDDSLNISDLLKKWFKSFNKEHLFAVAKDALEDERLFLIIDGIDEWSSISSAQQAIDRIETTIELFDCNVLYSSRPYGFKLLKNSFKEINELSLARFSQIQQAEFVTKWYLKWAESQKIIDGDFAKNQTDSFIHDLHHVGDLKKLVENPLLLSILIVQKMRDSILPKNKLNALKEITQYLISKHPLKRKKDAGIIDSSSNDINFNDIFCELAIQIQKENNDGVISKKDAYKTIYNYLINFAGYEKSQAKLRSKEIVDIGANHFGIIIEKSYEEISFSHRQFQEFLAAQYMFESDQEIAIEIIENYASNPVFHQVITNFFGLIPTKKTKEFSNFFEQLENSKSTIFQKHYHKLISYEVAIILENTPYNIATEKFDSIIRDFEYETDPKFKKSLFKLILNTFTNNRLKEKVIDFILCYFPNQSNYSDNRVRALRYSQDLNLWQIEFLENSIINGDIEIRLNASYALKKHIKIPRVFLFIKELIESCSNPDILPFAINSLISEDLDIKIIDKLICSLKSEHPLTQFFILKYNVFAQKDKETSLEHIIQIAKGLSYQLKEEILNLFIDGYSDNINLKNIAFESIQQRGYSSENRIDKDIAWKFLIHSFNTDEDVIRKIKNEIDKEAHPFVGIMDHKIWSYLPTYFPENKELILSVESWIVREQQERKYFMIENNIAFACLYVHSEEMKELLLEDLPKSGIPHWHVMALLEGWKNDSDVKEKLKNYFRKSDHSKSSYAASYISKVFDDAILEGIQILEQILFNHNLYFRDRAISALIDLDKSYFENNILERILADLDSFPKEGFSQYYSILEDIVKHFYTNPSVESYLLQNKNNDQTLYSIFVRYYSNQSTILNYEIKSSLPLSRELRLMIIESIDDLGISSERITNALSCFLTEEDAEIKADAAICLFKRFKDNKKRIIDICTPIVFGAGFDYEIQRNIAFSGFLIAHQLPEYLLMKEDSSSTSTQALPINIFDDYYHRDSTSGLIIQNIINEFEYLISVVGNDFQLLLKDNRSKELENIWGFFAKYSGKTSPSFPYISQFISENIESITDLNLINFLNRTTPKSNALKNILLRIINDDNRENSSFARLLGQNFNTDDDVYKIVKDVHNYSEHNKIIALSVGWPSEPILHEIFIDLVKSKQPINDYAGYYLKFLFRDIDNIMAFLSDVLSFEKDAIYDHRYFYRPLMIRLRKDRELIVRIKDKLLTAEKINEKVSYYNLLLHSNYVDDDVKKWKADIVDIDEDYGYDIVSNKTVRLFDILNYY